MILGFFWCLNCDVYAIRSFFVDLAMILSGNEFRIFSPVS